MEIERKFLIEGFPSEEGFEEKIAEQYYITTEPYIRIRRSESKGKVKYVLTFKGEGTLTRTETEIDLTEGQYEELKALCKGRPLRKRTRIYPLENGLFLEVSAVNEGEEEGFFYAEVEFPTEEAANAFVPLPYLGKDVTDNPEYKMNRVAERLNLK